MSPSELLEDEAALQPQGTQGQVAEQVFEVFEGAHGLHLCANVNPNQQAKVFRAVASATCGQRASWANAASHLRSAQRQ